jgi:hypothetical protein
MGLKRYETLAKETAIAKQQAQDHSPSQAVGLTRCDSFESGQSYAPSS